MDLIRDSLFSIQVKQPWLLLQYGNSDMESIGADRVERLLSTSPDENNGQDREEIVVEEIEDRENTNLTITKTINRLGTVFFLFMFNIGISVFVFLLTGIMIFSQVLFIIYAMFLPVSFLLSMVPSFEGMSKRAITKLFNTILTRAGITLIITVAFSISTMLYNLSGEYPFFLTAFLQIVTFAGIYFKLGDLMGMFSLQSGIPKAWEAVSCEDPVCSCTPICTVYSISWDVLWRLLGLERLPIMQENRLAQTRELLPAPALPNGRRQTTADQTDRQHRKRNPHGNGLALR